MRILFLTNIPSPYRVDFFNELGRYCDLTVIFEKAVSRERHASWSDYRFENFNGIILKGINVSVDKSLSLRVTKYLNNHKFNHIIVCNTFTPTGMYAIHYMKKHKIKYWIEGDGALPIKKGILKRRLKSYLITGAEGYFSTSETHDSYYLYYGGKRELICRYPFSSVQRESVLTIPVSNAEKRRIRDRLGINEKKIVLFVGQFIHRKGLDVLLDAALHIDRAIGVYLIGGCATSDMESFVKKHGLKNVHFIGFQNPKELDLYFKASDVFVLPTREDIWGLVVNEAMARGVPVITTNRCVAGLELIQNGKNGYIVPVDDSDILAKTIISALNSIDGSATMSEEALRIASLYTIQSMVESHIKSLKI